MPWVHAVFFCAADKIQPPLEWKPLFPWNQKTARRKAQGIPIYDVLFGIYMHMGVSLNGGTPETPQNDHF